MDIFLVNSNPVVSKLTGLTAKKLGATFNEFTALSLANLKHCDLLLIDSSVLEQITTAELASLSYKQLGAIVDKGVRLPDGYDFCIEKPFLPTELIEQITISQKQIKTPSEIQPFDDDTLDTPINLDDDMSDLDDDFSDIDVPLDADLADDTLGLEEPASTHNDNEEEDDLFGDLGSDLGGDTKEDEFSLDDLHLDDDGTENENLDTMGDLDLPSHAMDENINDDFDLGLDDDLGGDAVDEKIENDTLEDSFSLDDLETDEVAHDELALDDEMPDFGDLGANEEDIKIDNEVDISQAEELTPHDPVLDRDEIDEIKGLLNEEEGFEPALDEDALDEDAEDELDFAIDETPDTEDADFELPEEVAQDESLEDLEDLDENSIKEALGEEVDEDFEEVYTGGEKEKIATLSEDELALINELSDMDEEEELPPIKDDAEVLLERNSSINASVNTVEDIEALSKLFSKENIKNLNGATITIKIAFNE